MFCLLPTLNILTLFWRLLIRFIIDCSSRLKITIITLLTFLTFL
ncbi:hypothetical protein X777_11810 [Ooceraea biroi]|uniref:Uncharacterized protein n=1 Tax=Ooceraea biroi TaxID=2015173 RepID=A0A026W457_OOCBI|nr:hypothetical protein X777_11810 [Ooceraea biroi]